MPDSLSYILRFKKTILFLDEKKKDEINTDFFWKINSMANECLRQFHSFILCQFHSHFILSYSVKKMSCQDITEGDCVIV